MNATLERGKGPWRSATGPRPGSVALLLLAAALAGCSGAAGGSPSIPVGSLPPPRGDTGTLDPLEFGNWVGQNLVEADFEEPSDYGLSLAPRNDLLIVRGVVDSESYDQVYDVLNDRLSVGTLVFTLVPGSADDDVNLSLGRMIRERGLNTYLPAAGEIASGGTDLFLAGVRRIIERGARVGVHSWAGGQFTATDLPRDHPEHEKYLNYYRDLGISEDFYWFTIQSAPADGMHWMSEEELGRFQVYTDLIR